MGVVNLFKTNTIEDYYKPARVNNDYRGGKEPRKPKKKEEIKKRWKDNIIKDVRDLLRPKKKKTKQLKTEYSEKELFSNQKKYTLRTSKGQ